MAGDPADKPEGAHQPRRRRALRVPIADIPRASALEDSAGSTGNGEAHGDAADVDWDPPSGVTTAPDVAEDRDPTEPSFVVEPDPLEAHEPALDIEEPELDAADLSEPSIDVRFTEPPEEEATMTEPPETAPISEPPDDVRYSEPPEELFLDDADVLYRSDIAPSSAQAAEMLIPIPKPPPPPVESAEARPPEVETDEDGPWYEHFFGEHYLRTVRTPTPKEVAVECDFIERALRVPVGARVLDVGCGLGMQTVELASRGYHMVGLDISATMVSRAYDEAEDRGLQIDFVRGDMRDVTFEDPFDALLCWGTTFGYFSEEENELAVRQFHQALKPKGTLLLEVINRDFIIGSQPNQVWFAVDGSVCMEETDFDYETSRLRVKRRVASHDGNQRDRQYSVRLYALHEISALLERNGFRVEEISGREATLGIFFGVHSPKMIIRAERVPGLFAEENTPPPMPDGVAGPSQLPPEELETDLEGDLEADDEDDD